MTAIARTTTDPTMVEISSISIDHRWLNRAQINGQTVQTYASCYAAGAVLPPITVVAVPETHQVCVVDGVHRLLGATLAQCETIACMIISTDDAHILRYTANTNHGLPLSSHDWWALAESLLDDPTGADEDGEPLTARLGWSPQRGSIVRQTSAFKAMLTAPARPTIAPPAVTALVHQDAHQLVIPTPPLVVASTPPTWQIMAPATPATPGYWATCTDKAVATAPHRSPEEAMADLQWRVTQRRPTAHNPPSDADEPTDEAPVLALVTQPNPYQPPTTVVGTVRWATDAWVCVDDHASTKPVVVPAHRVFRCRDAAAQADLVATFLKYAYALEGLEHLLLERQPYAEIIADQDSMLVYTDDDTDDDTTIKDLVSVRKNPIYPMALRALDPRTVAHGPTVDWTGIAIPADYLHIQSHTRYAICFNGGSPRASAWWRRQCSRTSHRAITHLFPLQSNKEPLYMAANMVVSAEEKLIRELKIGGVWTPTTRPASAARTAAPPAVRQPEHVVPRTPVVVAPVGPRTSPPPSDPLYVSRAAPSVAVPPAHALVSAHRPTWTPPKDTHDARSPATEPVLVPATLADHWGASADPVPLLLPAAPDPQEFKHAIDTVLADASPGVRAILVCLVAQWLSDPSDWEQHARAALHRGDDAALLPALTDHLAHMLTAHSLDDRATTQRIDWVVATLTAPTP